MARCAKFATTLVIILALGACTRIGPGYVGIKVSNAGSMRGVDKNALTTGWVFYTPGASTVFEYPTFVQQVVLTRNTNEGSNTNDEITFTNKDQMTISADISFAYHLEQDKVPEFYTKFRNDDLNQFTHGYLKSLIRDKFNEVGGRYSIADIMGNNGPFLKEVHDSVQAEVAPFGVVMEAQFGFIGAPRPPAAVIESINQKVQAQQIAQQKQMEIQQAQADAQKAVATANGAAQAEVAQAEGDAKAALTRADAEAEANHKVAASLTQELVEWQKAKAWNGQLPQVTGSATPFIDLRAQGKDKGGQ